ncbi:carboxymuconolactone decarboxylase family protein [Sciscionella sediminilitoris]|uniref:carboxymuconolactone decarboxylase family protein n=1 Tax=Sciscionella sediminilitoris TaxID=1445613 RepID=UPI0004DF255B|nr:carboxymuconolactone decarboxylase family protein [Sciscionella sp. SE31]
MRINLSQKVPEARKHLIAMHTAIEKAAGEAGLSKVLIELVKIRASQINGCAFCLDMHVKDARKAGEQQQRLDLLPAWQETELYSPAERAALELTEAISRLSDTADIPDELYTRVAKEFTEDQFAVVTWAAIAINTFNRLNVTMRTPVPSA